MKEGSVTFATIIYYYLVRLKQSLLPKMVQEFVEDIFFFYCPVPIIRLVTVEYRGYLRHFVPKPGDVVIDCGAWKGHFTILASRLVGAKGRVVAIEPLPEACSRLNKRLARFSIKNVDVVSAGLDCREISVVAPLPKQNEFRLFGLDGQAPGPNSVMVSLRTLDKIVDEMKLPKVDFVKMDIEGSELEALDGMRETLSRNNAKLAIATYHVRDGKMTFEIVESKLRGLGYRALTEFPQHLTTYGSR